MSFETLIITSDLEAIRILKPELVKLGSKLHYCGEVSSAFDLLERKKFEAIIVDCDDVAGGDTVLQFVRKSSCNQSAITFALTNGKSSAKAAFDRGANFILSKPVSAESVARLFQSSEKLLRAERRRYFRHAVTIPAETTIGQQVASKAVITSLSEGGMGLQHVNNAKVGEVVKVRFRLPFTDHSIEARGEVAWVMASENKAGVRFFFIAQTQTALFEQWLRDRFE